MEEKAKKRYDFGWIYAQTRGNRRYLVCLMLAGIALAVVNIGMASVLKGFVDIATGDSRMSLAENVAAAFLILVSEGLLGLITSVSYQVSCNRIGQRLRLELAARLYRSRLLEMQEHHVGEYMTNLTADVEKVSGCIPTIAKNAVGNGLTAVFAVLYLFWLNWKLALLLLICIPLLILCIAVFSPVVQKASRRDKENEEEIRIYFQEVLEKIALFKIGFMGRRFAEKAQGMLEAKVQSACRLGAAEGGSAFLNNVMGTSMFLIAMGGGAYFVMRGELVVGAMIAVIQLTNYITWPFQAIGEIISNVNQSIVSAERLDRIYSLPEEPGQMGEPEQTEDLWRQEKPDQPRKPGQSKRSGQPGQLRKSGQSGRPGEWKQMPAFRKEVSCLRMRGVSFRYGDAYILKGIDADFGKNGIIGIVGESGGGKSTFLKVASGLYLPEEGEVSVILADGSVRNNVRPYVGLVPAADLIFRDTIEANICMAMEPDTERLGQCAAMANIDRYIREQEQQYDTVIGDGSQPLSSGQEQRIGIARALYQGAGILLFDEPTANLDAESIDIFLNTLDKAAADRICIVVTHDPRVMERCDKVYRLCGLQLMIDCG